MSVFAGYDPGDFFDETHDRDGEPRAHYRPVIDQLGKFSPGELSRREQLRDEVFRTAGITFTVYGEGDGVERTFPLDLVPRLVPPDEWDHIERGLVQRITVLNRFLEDLYVGERAAIRDGIVPWWLIASSKGFVREAAGIEVPHAARCLVAGVDLVRDDAGTYRVLEDNVRNPSGISYVLENRQAMTRVFPAIFALSLIHI